MNAICFLVSLERRTALAILVVLCLAAQSIWTLSAVAAELTAESSQAEIPHVGAPIETDRTNLWERAHLFDNLEIRRRFDDAPFKFGAQEQSEVFANIRGGLRHGVIYEGALQISLSVDTDLAFGLPGGTFYLSAYQIRGRNPSIVLAPVLQTLTSVEATPSTRLFTLYYEQSALDGRVSLRFGQLAADDEFIITQYGTLFVNSSFGFPGLPGVDLPSGGPIYPLAAPGVRLKVRPVPEVTLLGAAFNGDPAGPGIGDPQRRDASGTAFRLRDGVFAIVEVQYALSQQPDSTRLPGTYRFGGWYHSGQFADQRSDDSGLSLADPASSVPPRRHHGNYSLYAVADQMIWRKAETKEQGIGLFARIMGAPGDRNLIDFYVDGGVNWKGFIEARPNDSVGFAIAYARISDTARRLDRETAFFRGAPYPIRDSETVIEATYSYQIARWWQVQPDIQYIIHPSGNVPNPVDSTHKLKNALTFGLRVTVTF